MSYYNVSGCNCGMGDAPAPGCGVSEVVDRVLAGLPTGMKVAGLTVPLTAIYGLLKQELYKLVNAHINDWAANGPGYLSGQVASKVSGPALQALLGSGLNPTVKALGASLLGSALDNWLKQLFYKLGAELNKCQGVPEAQVSIQAWIGQTDAKPPVADPTDLAPPMITDWSLVPNAHLGPDISASMDAIRAKEAQVFLRPSEQVSFTAVGPVLSSSPSSSSSSSSGAAAAVPLVLVGLLALKLLA